MTFVLSVSLTRGLAHCRCLFSVYEKSETIANIREQG